MVSNKICEIVRVREISAVGQFTQTSHVWRRILYSYLL